MVCCRIGRKLACLHHESPEFSVWGTMGCRFFLFCSDLDSRYVLPLVSFGVCSPQACLKRMLNEMQRDGGQFGVQEGLVDLRIYEGLSIPTFLLRNLWALILSFLWLITRGNLEFYNWGREHHRVKK